MHHLVICILLLIIFSEAGDVQYQSFKSSLLKQSVSYSVILPASYRDGSGKYPVVYSLHCAGCSHTSILDQYYFGNFTAHIDSARFIVVAPYDGSGFSWWLDSPIRSEADYSRFLVEELKPHIDSVYRTMPGKEYTGLCGHSMGGYGSLYNSAKHPETFGYAYAIKPCTDIKKWHDSFQINAVLGNKDDFPAHYDSVDILSHPHWFSNSKNALYIYTGVNDNWFYEENLAFHDSLSAWGIDHEFEEKNEGHSPVPDSSVKALVVWFNRHFATNNSVIFPGPGKKKLKPKLSDFVLKNARNPYYS